MFGALGRMRGQGLGLAGPDRHDAFGDRIGKARAGRIDPGQAQIRQGGKCAHQRPAHMARTPDPDLAFGAGDRFHHPALQKLRARALPLPARRRQQPLDRKRHRRSVNRPGNDRIIQRLKRLGIIDFGQKADRAATALTQLRPQSLAVKPHPTPVKHFARPRDRLPFQRAAADGARLAHLPDQHRSPHFTRRRSVMGGNHHPGNASMFRHRSA